MGVRLGRRLYVRMGKARGNGETTLSKFNGSVSRIRKCFGQTDGKRALSSKRLVTKNLTLGLPSGAEKAIFYYYIQTCSYREYVRYKSLLR